MYLSEDKLKPLWMFAVHGTVRIEAMSVTISPRMSLTSETVIININSNLDLTHRDNVSFL
jgi:hypothetical protein